MERYLDVDWDDDKSALLQKERGFSLNEVAILLASPRNESKKTDDPLQILATGYVQGKMISLVYEIRESETQSYYWLVTYWPATTTERKMYERKVC